MGTAIVAAGGCLMAGNATCTSFFGDTFATAIDFCFIFDCTNGILGGTINPCPDGTLLSGEAVTPLFVDCPVVEGP